jgi:hypothetical protein
MKTFISNNWKFLNDALYMKTCILNYRKNIFWILHSVSVNIDGVNGIGSLILSLNGFYSKDYSEFFHSKLLA